MTATGDGSFALSDEEDAQGEQNAEHAAGERLARLCRASRMTTRA
jgi:hypothetical protein